MSRWQYVAALIALYGVLVLFVIGVLVVLASFTVLPMYQNYRDHGSVFLRSAA